MGSKKRQQCGNLPNLLIPADGANAHTLLLLDDNFNYCTQYLQSFYLAKYDIVDQLQLTDFKSLNDFEKNNGSSFEHAFYNASQPSDKPADPSSFT